MTETNKNKIIKVEILLADFIQEYQELQLLSEDEQRASLAELLKERFKGAEKLQEIELLEDRAIISWIFNPTIQEADELNKQALEAIRSKQVDKAIELWLRAIEINPVDPDYHYNLGLGYFSAQNSEKGIDCCLEAIRICPVYFRAYFVLGSVYSKQKKYDKAEEFTRNGLLLSRKNIQALINLGALYSMLSKYDKAIKCFDRVVELSPKEPKAYLGLGKLYNLLNDPESAIRYYRAVTKISTDIKMIEIANQMIKKLETQVPEKQVTESAIVIPAEETQLARTKEPENINLLYAEGYQYFIDGKYEKSIEKYNEYLKYRETDVEVWASLASCQARTGNFDDAIMSINKAIAYESDSRPIFFKQAAIIYDAAEQYENSGQSARNAFEMGKQDSSVLTLIGKSLFKLDKVSESISFLDDAVKMNNHNLTARYYLGKALKSIGENDKAIENFEEIVWSKFKSPLKTKARDAIKEVMG